MEKLENPFGEVVKSLQQNFAQPNKMPQFGLAEVLEPDPVSVRFAGMVFQRSELLVNYTLEPYDILARGTRLSGRLMGETNFCPEGCRHMEKKVSPSDDESQDSTLSGNVAITDTGLRAGDMVFAYYSQEDQRLVLLCKVV